MKRKPYENLENAPTVAGVAPSERHREIRDLEFRRLGVTSALELVLDDYRKEGGGSAPRRRRKKVGKEVHDYHP